MATISIIFTAERRHFVGNKCGIPEDVAGNNIYRYDLHTDETTLLTTTRSSANQTCSSTNGRYGFPIVYGTPDNRNEGVEGPVVLDLIKNNTYPLIPFLTDNFYHSTPPPDNSGSFGTNDISTSVFIYDESSKRTFFLSTDFSDQPITLQRIFLNLRSLLRRDQ